MAIVPIATPTVDNRPAPFVPQQGAQSPDAFGASIGQGAQSLGQGVQGAGQVTGAIAADMAIQSDIRAAKDADTQQILGVSNLGYKGDGKSNPGFYNLRGQAAVDGQSDYAAALEANRQDIAKGLSPRAAGMFLNSSASRIANEVNTSNRFVAQQNDVANLQSSQARAGAASSAVMNTYNDPVAIEKQAQVIRGEMATQGQLNGWSPDTLAQNTTIALSKTYGDAIKMALGASDINTASRLYNLYGPQMDAASRVQIQEQLKVPLRNAAASAAVNDALGIHTTIGAGIPAGGAIAASDMPPEQQAFLRTLSGPESAGKYNVRYTPQGGTTFGDLSHHPQIPEPTKDGRTSDAAGRYQFLSSTYLPLAAKMGLSDFSPASQDKAAFRYASDTYAKNNGGADLAADLKAGGHAKDIAGALNQAWPSLPGGSQQGTSMGAFTAGLARMETGPTAATVAADTKVHPDFSAAYDTLMAKYSGDPEMQWAVTSKLRAAESTYNLGVKTQREGLTKTFTDTQAALQDGKDVPIPELAIRHAFDPPVADEMMAKLNDAQQFGQIYKGVQFMPADGYAAARAAISDGLGAKAAMSTDAHKVVTPGSPQPDDANTVPNVAGYAAKQKQLAMFDRAWTQRQTQVAADPAAYARNEPSVAAAFAAINPQDPTTLASALSKSRDTQISLGVAPSDVATLSNAGVGALVKQLHTTDPSKGDMGAQLDAVAKQYGPAWPDVFHDLVTRGKLDPAYQVLGSMSDPTQAGARADLQRALMDKAVKGDKFGSGVPWDQKQALTQGVDDHLADFRATTQFGGGSMFDSVVKPAVSALATHYATGGMAGDDAAQQAASQIIGAKYDISGSLRVPKTFNGRPLGMDAVQSAGATVQRGLTDAAMGTGPGAFTAAEARNGTWAINPDEGGVTLLARKQGVYQVVKGKDGKPISMDFGNLPKPDAIGSGMAVPGGAGQGAF